MTQTRSASWRLLALVASALLALGLLASPGAAGRVLAADGDNLATIIADRTGTDCASYNAEGNHNNVGVGIAFDGTNLLISCYGDNTVTAVSPADGSQVGIHPITGASALGALAWDESRGLLWACSAFSDVGTIDLATDIFTYVFTSQGCFDGLAYDGADDTIWSSGDVSGHVEHYTTAGAPISSTNVALGNCGNSGIAVGGANLYLANNGCSEIYRASKDFSSVTLFASFPARLEDLECDNLTFAGSGKGAIWSIDAYDNILNAWEIPVADCQFGGGGGESRLQVNKFYDLNANGVNDGEAAIAGWQVRIHDGFDIFANTPVDLVVEPDDYTVTESAPVQPNWIPTTATSVNVTVDAGETEVVEFGNVCLGAGGGLTLGFWSNKNGKDVMSDGGSLAPELALLSSLNLRNEDGSNFDPATYNQFRSWLLSANASNMAYMLSAQLAAMALNVEAGFVNPAALIYAPGTLSANPLGFASVAAVMAEANALLGADGLIPDGDPLRARAEALKNALDRANNNLNFVQAASCAFTFPHIDQIIDADGVASAGDGIPAAVDVAVGNALHSFPVTGSNDSGLDMFDNDANGAWTFGPAGDDLMAEGSAFCPGALRNGQYDTGFDCAVLDHNASLANGQPVNCDLEFLIAFTACPANVAFHDMDLDGAWDSGEDIVLDVNANGIYD